MKELSYKTTIGMGISAEDFALAENLKSRVKNIVSIDTFGLQILMGLLSNQRISFSDLSEQIQSELIFVGASGQTKETNNG
jgi:hypothetical protein